MQKTAFIAVFVAAILAGFSGLFIKYMDTMSATSIAWLRTVVPVIGMGGWMAISKIKFFPSHVKPVLAASVLNAIRMYLFFVAYIYTSIGNAVIMCYTWPIFATILGYFFLKESISKGQVILLGLAFLGIVVAYSGQPFSFENKDFIGMGAAVLSALIYSSTVIIFKSESERYSRSELVFYQNIVGSIVYLPFFVFGFKSFDTGDIGIGFVYAILIGIIGFRLFFYGLKYLKASIASTIMYLEIVSALILSYLWMGDRLEPQMIIGGSLILVSSILIVRK